MKIIISYRNNKFEASCVDMHDSPVCKGNSAEAATRDLLFAIMQRGIYGLDLSNLEIQSFPEREG